MARLGGHTQSSFKLEMLKPVDCNPLHDELKPEVVLKADRILETEDHDVADDDDAV